MISIWRARFDESADAVYVVNYDEADFDTCGAQQAGSITSGAAIVDTLAGEPLYVLDADGSVYLIDGAPVFEQRDETYSFEYEVSGWLVREEHTVDRYAEMRVERYRDRLCCAIGGGERTWRWSLLFGAGLALLLRLRGRGLSGE